MEEYIVSARKYRPTTFDSVVGQTALTTTLKNAVKSGKLAHAYLFCGPRGVGKTTCARIFAKAINCLHPTPDGEACNECESCQAFNEQRSLNIFELDAASNNSVEHIKALMEQTRIPPQMGRYKVFIIDEVHMLSTQAFNAFLKTLEEPPAHVIFILATTEKHKILPTILSRCQIYDFERMTLADTVNHLKRVAEKEGIQYEDEALSVIAEKADGGMRDALSIFDQATSFCQGNITYKKVIEDLNVLDADNYFRIIDLSLANKAADIMVLLNGVINKGFDGGKLIVGLAKHVRNVLMAKDESTLPLLEVSEQMRERYRTQAQQCPIPFLYKALKLMNQCDVNYRQSSNKRLLVELTLIEIAQITQPADSDTPGAGRQPRRLKSLFRNLVRQNRPATKAPQVASAGTHLAERHAHATAATAATETATNETKAPAQPATTYDKAHRPVLKNGKEALGYSWSNLRQAAKPRKMQVIPGSLDANDPNAKPKANENEVFSQQDLELQWMSMCNRMPQQFSGVAARMKNMQPNITNFPNVEVLADNQLVYDQVNEIKNKIAATLKIYLHNSFIELSVRLAEQKEQVKILTRREQFEEMSKKNPALEKLRQLMELELA
mgnify:CR=1 FL=1